MIKNSQILKFWLTYLISYNISQIADVAFSVGWSTMRLIIRVKVSSSAGATVRQVAELVNVETVFSGRQQVLQASLNHHWTVETVLAESNDSAWTLVSW